MKTLDELKAEGWEYVCNFGYSWVFARGDERILWTPLTKEVALSYKHQTKKGV